MMETILSRRISRVGHRSLKRRLRWARLRRKVQSQMKKEEEEDSGVHLPHFHHDEHRLSLMPAREGDICIACWKLFDRPQPAYSCSIKGCGYKKLMHQECAEMPMRIIHPRHTHTLTQKHFGDVSLKRGLCEACKRYIHGLGYYCSEGCVFQLHLGCASPYATDGRRIKHPSHPQHELQQLNRLHTFRCDACGSTRNQTNSSYICVTCQYWIHDECANKPPIAESYIHHHPLYPAYCLKSVPCPEEYCGVCDNSLNKYWVYVCQTCSFGVHMKCLLTLENLRPPRKNDPAGDIISIWFPINDISQGFIRPFVLRELGPNNSEYQSHHHKLSLLSDDEDEDEDEDEDIGGSEVICDGCTTPIHRPKYMNRGEFKYFVHLSCSHLPPVLPRHPLHKKNHKMILQSCPEDTFEVLCDICGLTTSGLFYACAKCNDFRIDVKCATSEHASVPHYKFHNLKMLVTDKDLDKPRYTSCKNFVHLACSQLPPELDYHPLHQPNHRMMLQTCPKDTFVVQCDICHLFTTGLFYACAECDSFKIDIKCASIPNTIDHASHWHKYHNIKMMESSHYGFRFSCRGCGYKVDSAFYKCDSCLFIFCFRCALLPKSIQHRWDDHPLSLVYDRADLNHPDDPFYCEVCEEEMDGELWMYHCGKCDQSFHPDCIPTETGEYRNIKFGRQYVATNCHDHPLSHQLITTKLRCDLCRRDESVFGRPGFYCELCNFVMCFDRCGKHAFN